MKIKEFLNKYNRGSSDVTVEICDCNVSLDNRTRISVDDLWKGKYGEFGKLNFQSFTVSNGKMIIYGI